MTVLSFLLLLLVAAICGAIGQAIVGFSRGGLLTTIAIGFIGALFGMWLGGLLGLKELFAVNIGGYTFPIVWSIVGAALFVAIISFFTRRRYI
ncbi:MAG: GlsB/YeaQ/YmgE family stress response membrane protein [Acidobacteriota bacterium]